MAAINTRVVRRSNALLGYAWGTDFRYSECQAFSRGPRGLLGATTMTVGLRRVPRSGGARADARARREDAAAAGRGAVEGGA